MLKLTRIFKWISLILVSIVLIVIGYAWYASEKIPAGERGIRAEALADKMLDALGKTQYDSLKKISWSFPRGHDFIWDKKNNIVNVRWSDFDVTFSPETGKGEAYNSELMLQGKEKEEALQKAWRLFANDSFWLVAPFKVRDPGTERKLVQTETGPGLLVTYTTGGVTPGDSYLWILDENGRPASWKMWVKIIPIKGIELSWEGWKNHKGCWFGPLHRGPGPFAVNLKQLVVE